MLHILRKLCMLSILPFAGNIMYAVIQVLVPPRMRCWCMLQMDCTTTLSLPLHLVLDLNIMLIEWALHSCQLPHSDTQHDLSCHQQQRKHTDQFLSQH